MKIKYHTYISDISIRLYNNHEFNKETIQQLITTPPLYNIVDDKEYKYNKQNHVTHPPIVSSWGHVLDSLHAAPQ